MNKIETNLGPRKLIYFSHEQVKEILSADSANRIRCMKFDTQNNVAKLKENLVSKRQLSNASHSSSTSSSTNCTDNFEHKPRSSKLATIFCIHKHLLKSNALLKEAELSLMNHHVQSSEAAKQQSNDLMLFVKEQQGKNAHNYARCKIWLQALRGFDDDLDINSDIDKSLPLIIPEIESNTLKLKSLLHSVRSSLGKNLQVE